MSEAEVVIKCVRSSDENSTPGLQEAFETLSSHGVKTEWISPEKCLDFEEKSRNIAFVFDPFEGEAFAHLSTLGFRILGPQCILSSLLMKIDIPKRRSPVYNLAMKDLVISCTSIDKDNREKIHHKVELMGGTVLKDFTENVTHLISGEVGSKKYQVAAALQRDIMSPDWVQAVWEKSRYRHVHASDDQFNKYRCLLFKGFCVSVSGLQQEDRKEVKKLIESEGGKYSGEMKMDTCTHLVINEPKGTKYEFALKWKIHTVTSRWIYVSIEKGYCQLEDEYNTFKESVSSNNNNTTHKTSTPTKDISKIQESHLGDISAISNSSIMGGHNMQSALHISRRQSSIPDRLQVSLDIDLKETTKDFFLDGLKIYLSGFRNLNLEKLRKIINSGGATRFNNINESVTHVVIGEPIDSDINLIKSGEYSLFAVSAQWLVDCYRQEKHLDEAAYLCLDLPVPLPTSPNIKSKSKVNQSNGNHDSTLAAAADLQDDMDILSQYLPQKESTQNTTVAHRPDSNCEPQDQSTFVMEGLFSGKKFILLDFNDGEMENMIGLIAERGGRVVPENKRIVADYGVVPLTGYPVTVAVTEVVTYAWLNMCIEEDCLLDIESNNLFRPVDVVEDLKPLSGCVLSISGYSGTHRNCIVDIAEMIGAKCQDHFVRRPHKGHAACSHLIVNEPGGPKYNAAIKWKVPALSKDWIFACAKSGKRLPEDRYLIDNQDALKPAQNTSQRIPRITSDGVRSNDDKVNSKLVDDNMGYKLKSTGETSTHEMCVVNSSDDIKKLTDDHKVMQSSNEDKIVGSSAEEKVPSSSAEETRFNLANPMEDFTAQRLKNRAFQDNQLLNVHKMDLLKANTPPVKPKHSRIQELKIPVTPGPGTPTMDTPSKFVAPGLDFHPNFNLTEIMKDLQSPINRRDSFAELTSTIKMATEQSAIPVERCPTPLVHRTESITPVTLRPLAGVTIYVSKKLSAKISQFHDLVSDLGGDYQWKYTPSCTHVIFQGRANDVNKEFRTARDDDKLIVSSHWLLACQEQQDKVEEASYPHNYNPKLCLNVKSTPGRLQSTPRATPLRTGRQNLRSTRAINSQVKTVDISPQNFPKLNLQDLTKLESKNTDSKSSSESEKDGNAKHSKNRLRTKKQSDSEREDQSKTSSESEGRSKSSDKETARRNKTTTSESERDAEEQNEIKTTNDEQPQEIEMESGGTLEMKIAISKQLDDIMAAAKSKKPAKRKSRRMNSSGNLSASGNNIPDNRPSSRQETRDMTSEKRKTKSIGKANEEYSGATESQSVLVTWDDPVGRLEKEKLAAKLEQACSPTQTQNTEDYMAGIDMPQDGQYSEVEDNNTSTDGEQNKHNSSREKRTPTPEAPSLAFPIKRKSMSVKSPEPVELIEEVCNEPDPSPKKSHCTFLLSGMTNEERVDYGALVEQLGGKVMEGQHYEACATHLVTGSPGRNEKFLACVAAGKWILHKSYFEACRREKKFVQEELYEWGGEATKSLHGVNSNMLKLAAAANRWRQKIQEMSKVKEKVGAFSGWRVILSTDKNKESNFSRLLVAGGAEVLPIKPPYPDELTATHAFLELYKVPLNQSDLECLLMANVLCLKPEFIPAHLTDASVSPEDFTPTEISSLKASLPDTSTSKRKFVTANTPNKRSRKH